MYSIVGENVVTFLLYFNVVMFTSAYPLIMESDVPLFIYLSAAALTKGKAPAGKTSRCPATISINRRERGQLESPLKDNSRIYSDHVVDTAPIAISCL